MAEVNKFSFFESFGEAAAVLPDEQRLAFYDALVAYAFRGEEPDFDGILKVAWALARPNIDSSIKRSKTNSENARKAKVETTEKTVAKTTAKTTAKATAKTKPSKDKDKEKDRDMDKEEFVPLERTNSSKNGASAATAAAGAAPPPRNEAKPFCPMCDTPLWKNTQTGNYRCGKCFDEYAEDKAAWR